MTPETYISGLVPKAYDEAAEQKARARFDSLAKPLDGLGLFEDMICRIAGMEGTSHPLLGNRILVIACADNGIVEEGISQSSWDVTAGVAASMSRGVSSACLMAEEADCHTLPVDTGIRLREDLSPTPRPAAGEKGHYTLLDRSAGRGTENFLKSPAMSEDCLLYCLQQGVDLVKDLKDMGYRIICTGEMGIGNTTTATAVAASILHLDPREVTGRGAGLCDASLERKISVIEEAISRYDLTRAPASRVLRTVGGYDMAFLAGIFMGGAVNGVPVIIDGIISAASALAASRLMKESVRYMLPSHGGRGPLVPLILKDLGLEAVISGKLMLGEGTGALMMLPLLDMALRVYEDQVTFGGLDMESYERYGGSDA